MSPKKSTQKAAKTRPTIDKKSKGFTDEERSAMKERAEELKVEARRGGRAKKNAADGERDVLAKIAAMPEPDRAMATRLHAIIKASAPALSPKTWYGMPAYSTFGFSDKANLDEAAMWPVAFALKELAATEEAQIVALVKKAAG